MQTERDSEFPRGVWALMAVQVPKAQWYIKEKIIPEYINERVSKKFSSFFYADIGN